MRYTLFFCFLKGLISSVYAQDLGGLSQQKLSIATGYIGGFEYLTDNKDKLNGLFLNGNIKVNSDVSLFFEYNIQKMSLLKFYELSTGIQYKIYDTQKVSVGLGAGAGYMWLDQILSDPDQNITADLKLSYISIPLFIESEVNLTKNISSFTNLSYKWLFGYDSKFCISSRGIQIICDSINENTSGLIYKLGLRYNF